MVDSNRVIGGAKQGRVFESLTHRRRRRALAVLRESPEPLSLREVAVELARGPADEERIEGIEVTLHHWHVPKLEEAELVEFDAERDEMSLTEAATEAESSEGEYGPSVA